MPARLAGRSAKVSLKYQSGQNDLHISDLAAVLSSPLLSSRDQSHPAFGVGSCYASGGSSHALFTSG